MSFSVCEEGKGIGDQSTETLIIKGNREKNDGSVLIVSTISYLC